MPYTQEHKARVRRRIVRSARDLFNRKGYEAVSIDEVMASAGLTRGGFYAHFRNKAELFREAIGFILKEHPAHEWPGVDFDLTRGNLARTIVNAYLSEAHLNDLERSCPLVSQASAVGRAEEEVRAVYADVLRVMADTIRRSIPGEDGTAARQALAVTALCVGGLALARAVNETGLANDIREASRQVALQLLESAPVEARSPHRGRASRDIRRSQRTSR